MDQNYLYSVVVLKNTCELENSLLYMEVGDVSQCAGEKGTFSRVLW